jgi:predicted Fe-Mo cluster-binding NifX family protein
MKVAFTVWEDRISPLFDASQKLLIVEIKNAKVINRYYEHFKAEIPLKRACRLCESGIDVLVCGAISEMPSAMLNAYGIHLIPFITGKAEDVLNAYINGMLSKPAFQMPGCCFARSQACERVKRRDGFMGKSEKEAVMPRGDGTGPQGQGPVGKGRCGCRRNGQFSGGQGRNLNRPGNQRTGNGPERKTDENQDNRMSYRGRWGK